MLNNFKIFLFCSHTFGVRCSIDALDPDNRPGPGQIRPGQTYLLTYLLTDIRPQVYGEKKVLKIIWNIHSIVF